jgi:hypothetical protein
MILKLSVVFAILAGASNPITSFLFNLSERYSFNSNMIQKYADDSDESSNGTLKGSTHNNREITPGGI